MAVNKKFLTTLDIGLMAGIAVLSLGGLGFAAVAGIVTLPGVKPILTADKPIKNPPSARPSQALASPNLPADIAAVSPSPTPTPAASPTLTPAVTLSPSPSSSPSPSPSSSPSPSASPSPSPESPPPNPTATRDDRRKSDLASLQVDLNEYFAKNKKYPLATTFSQGRTDNPTTPLKALIDGGYAEALPLDPTEGYWYGYKSTSNGKSCSLTARLEVKTDPAGQYNQAKPPIYLYTLPCR